jgi:hypothetical protein
MESLANFLAGAVRSYPFWQEFVTVWLGLLTFYVMHRVIGAHRIIPEFVAEMIKLFTEMSHANRLSRSALNALTMILVWVFLIVAMVVSPLHNVITNSAGINPHDTITDIVVIFASAVIIFGSGMFCIKMTGGR